MSWENNKVCCNCRHDIRIWDKGYCRNWCEIKKHYMSYVQVMDGWCRHWAEEKWEVFETYDGDCMSGFKARRKV